MAIYFLYNKYLNSVKIGFSQDVSNRINKLALESGAELELISCVEGNRSLENRLHRLFKEYRTIGEWFEFTGLVRLFLDEFKIPNENNLARFYVGRYLIENHKFNVLTVDEFITITQVFRSLKAIYEDIFEERKDIGRGITISFLDFLDKEKIRLRYFTYLINWSDNEVILEPNSKGELEEEAKFQLQMMGNRRTVRWKF